MRVIPPRSTAPLLAIVGGGAIAVGAWLPWMSYFAGLYPLRGIIGVNGRLLLGAAVVGVVAGIVLARSRAPRVRRYTRRGVVALGALVMLAAVWLLIGVRELTRVRAANAMFAPKPGGGLVVVLVGGALLALAAAVPDRSDSDRAAATAH